MPTAEPEARELLTFQLDTELVAVNAIQVREILDRTPVTEVPGAPDFVRGLIHVRGQIIPLADLRRKLDLEPLAPTVDSRIVVVEIMADGEPLAVGILADKVYEVTELSDEQIETAPRIGMRWRPEHVRFIGKRGADLIIALEIERIIADELPGRVEPIASQQTPDPRAATADTPVH